MKSTAFNHSISFFYNRTIRQIYILLLTIIFFISFMPDGVIGQPAPFGQESWANPDSDTDVRKVKSASFPDGAHVICWLGSNGIMGKTFDSNGTALTATFTIFPNTYQDERRVNTFSVFCIDNLSLIVCWDENWMVWDDSDTMWYDYGHCYAQILNKYGEKIGGRIQLSTDDKLCNHMPVVTGFDENQMIVFWQAQKFNQDSTRNFIFGRVLDRSNPQTYSPFLVTTYLMQWWADRYDKIVPLKLADHRVIVLYSHHELGLYGTVIASTDGSQASTIEFSNSSNINDFAALKQIDNFVLCYVDLGVVLNLSQYNDENCQLEKSNSSLINFDKGYWTGDPDCFEMIPFNESEYLVFWGSTFDYFGCKINFKGQMSREFTFTDLNCIWFDRQLSVSTVQDDRFVLCYIATKDTNSYDYNAMFKLFPTTSLPLTLSDFTPSSPKNDETITDPSCTFRWQNPTRVKELFPFDVVSDLYIDTDPGFSNPQIIADIEDTSYAITTLKKNRTYFWKVLGRNSAGQNLWSEVPNRAFYLKGDPSAVTNTSEPWPKVFTLTQNYPNPFNARTVISYTIPEQAYVKLEIFDIQGRFVQTLLSGSQTPGDHQITFDASDLPSGLYFYRLLAGSFSDVKKMSLLK
jgi:hypothetical protein